MDDQSSILTSKINECILQNGRLIVHFESIYPSSSGVFLLLTPKTKMFSSWIFLDLLSALDRGKEMAKNCLSIESARALFQKSRQWCQFQSSGFRTHHVPKNPNCKMDLNGLTREHAMNMGKAERWCANVENKRSSGVYLCFTSVWGMARLHVLTENLEITHRQFD